MVTRCGKGEREKNAEGVVQVLAEVCGVTVEMCRWCGSVW